jgi:hypothetical protein
MVYKLLLLFPLCWVQGTESTPPAAVCRLDALSLCSATAGASVEGKRDCVATSHCSSFVDIYTQQLSALPLMELKTPGFSVFFADHKKSAPHVTLSPPSAGLDAVISRSGHEKSTVVEFTVTLLSVRGEVCSSSQFDVQCGGASSSAFERCWDRKDRTASCECTGSVILDQHEISSTLSFAFTSKIALEQIDIIKDITGPLSGSDSQRTSRFLAAAADAAIKQGEGDIVVDPAADAEKENNPAVVVHAQHSSSGAKAIHSFFVLVAFAGNAAFLIFVFWLSKF